MLGGVLYAAIIIAAFFSERLWLRIVCWLYIIMYNGIIIFSVIFGDTPKEYLIFPTLWFILMFIASEVKREISPNRK
jgi:hypothetical protein